MLKMNPVISVGEMMISISSWCAIIVTTPVAIRTAIQD